MEKNIVKKNEIIEEGEIYSERNKGNKLGIL